MDVHTSNTQQQQKVVSSAGGHNGVALQIAHARRAAPANATIVITTKHVPDGTIKVATTNSTLVVTTTTPPQPTCELVVYRDEGVVGREGAR